MVLLLTPKHGLQVVDSETCFRTKVKAGGLMDVVETYPWDGSDKTFGRRDKRRGFQTGHISAGERGPTMR